MLLPKNIKTIQIRVALTILGFVFTSILISQENTKRVQQSNQQWVQYYNRLTLNDKFTFLSDISFRWKDELNDYSLSLLRFGIMYKLKNKVQISGGVAATTAHQQGHLTKGELRGWQEILFSENIGRVAVSNRIRLEERYFRNIYNDRLVSGYNYNYRFRYRSYFTIPLNHSQIIANTVSLNIGDEIFINFGKEIIYNTLDNNRLIVGLSYQINKNQSIGLNYVNQFSHRAQINSFENSEILWLTFTHNIVLKRHHVIRND